MPRNGFHVRNLQRRRPKYTRVTHLVNCRQASPARIFCVRHRGRTEMAIAIRGVSAPASKLAQEIDTVWTAIALHTTPGIPQHMHPVIALVTAGVEMDVLGVAYSEFSDAEREAVVRAHPRSGRFKEDIIQAFYDGIKHKPHTTF